MNRKELTQTVKEMIAAPSCCQELKAAGEKCRLLSRMDIFSKVLEFFTN